MVNQVLAEEMRSRVHALAIEAIAPEEDLSFIELEDDDSRLRELLLAAGLPADDLAGKLFVGMARGDHSLVATGGLDLSPPFALLRSLAVRPDLKGQGFGRVMAIKMLGEARNAGVLEVYLLTTNAARFFAQFGFETVTRDEVPADIANTSQFRGSTCASAQPMRLRLQPIG
jgi:N-acetylglutamate synthase-like GNAT family acetyltransferase